MRKTPWILACTACVLMHGTAIARPMSTMEWMDPKGFDIWKSLSAGEKTESVKAMIEQADAQRKPEEKQFLSGKTEACVDKEAADPDYKGVQIPLYVPWTYCMTKYSAILENKSK